MAAAVVIKSYKSGHKNYSVVTLLSPNLQFKIVIIFQSCILINLQSKIGFPAEKFRKSLQSKLVGRGGGDCGGGGRLG